VSNVAPPSSNFYLDVLRNDPLYRQSQADISAQGIQDAGAAGAAILRGLVQRGLVPDLNAAAQKLGLSPEVLDFISKNVDLGHAMSLAQQLTAAGVSQEGQLQREHAAKRQSILDALGARGMASSGALPFLQGEEEHEYTLGRYNADQALANLISGSYGAYTTAERMRADALRQALEAAYSRSVDAQGSTPPPSSGPAFEPSSVDPGDYLKALMLAARTGKAVAI